MASSVAIKASPGYSTRIRTPSAFRVFLKNPKDSLVKNVFAHRNTSQPTVPHTRLSLPNLEAEKSETFSAKGFISTNFSERSCVYRCLSCVSSSDCFRLVFVLARKEAKC